jgi:Uma2 family endonuclease
MSPQARQVKFTYEDYLLFPDDGKRHELLDGERFVTPAPSTQHQRLFGNLLYSLKDHLRQTGAGDVFGAPTDVVLSGFDVVQPDLLFVSAARTSIITEKNIQGAPDLVIEILSEATRKTDEVIKRKLYERHGVSEYWIVDPDLATVKVYRMTGRGYARAAELFQEANDKLETPLLPGFSLALSQIFA